MRPLASRLESRGWTTSRFGYRTVREDPREQVADLAEAIRSREAPIVHLVGHSMGGLLALAALDAGDLPPGRVVLLGSPVGGSSVARRLHGAPLIGRLTGSSAELLEEGAGTVDTDREIGVVAGNAGIGLGRLVGGIDGPSDGTVAVSETRLEAAADHLTLPVSHTGMLFASSVAEAVDAFLRRGRFGESA